MGAKYVPVQLPMEFEFVYHKQPSLLANELIQQLKQLVQQDQMQCPNQDYFKSNSSEEKENNYKHNLMKI